ncbi:MAG: GAF domain-containing sensor histidine kinase [Deltaproteobacteria bacterium]|nr:GAF domain-containing sensor histidine kinase [Deltaproteobacteria bacterium]
MRDKTQELIDTILKEPWAEQCLEGDAFREHLSAWIKDSLFPGFLTQIINQVDEIIDIDPELPDQDILTRANRHIVEFLGAQSASVRIYDPLTEQMLSYGSFPFDEKSRATYIPLDNSVAGKVLNTGQTYLVPNILDEELYRDKSVVERKGAYSIMAVPLAIPRFFPYERDTVGVIQIYFSEKDREFKTLEIQVAEVLARRLSFVVARKKILTMQRVNEKKETIVRKIFLKLGGGHGIKMKDVFNRLIPELADIINVQSCALFSVTDDMETVILEAGYPDYVGYHGVGKRFSIIDEPAFEVVLNRITGVVESPYEVITQSYVLVVDPQRSALVSSNVKRFAASHSINSILYVPLNVGEEVTHFMTFDALDQRERYTEGEIEIFLFLGRELMKAQRMERLDDILHDFKNPAIATAGFARRLKRLIDEQPALKDDQTIKRYVEILLEETSRLQEMALSLYHIGKVQTVNISLVLRNRFEINKEAIREQLKQNVELQEGPFLDPLFVRCYPLHLERILDNLLNNATNAIPLQGGILAIRTYAEEEWACAEITNTGLISEEERLRLLEGEGQGRGLYITHRIVRLLKGKIDIRVSRDTTTLLVRLPLYREQTPDTA